MTQRRKLVRRLISIWRLLAWQVEDYKNLNLRAALGVAIQEFQLEAD